MGVYRRVLTCKSFITYLALSISVDGEIQPGYKNGRKRRQNPLESVSKGIKKACCKARCTNGLPQRSLAELKVVMDCDGLARSSLAELKVLTILSFPDAEAVNLLIYRWMQT